MQPIFIVMKQTTCCPRIEKVFNEWEEAEAYINYCKKYIDAEYMIFPTGIEKWELDE